MTLFNKLIKIVSWRTVGRCSRRYYPLLQLQTLPVQLNGSYPLWKNKSLNNKDLKSKLVEFDSSVCSTWPGILKGFPERAVPANTTIKLKCHMCKTQRWWFGSGVLIFQPNIFTASKHFGQLLRLSNFPGGFSLFSFCWVLIRKKQRKVKGRGSLEDISWLSPALRPPWRLTQWWQAKIMFVLTQSWSNKNHSKLHQVAT